MVVEWLDTVSNQSILLPLLCREKHFPAQLTSPIQNFLRLRYLFSYCLEMHLQLHLPIISSKQLTVPENQQLGEWSMETAVLVAHSSCAPKYWYLIYMTMALRKVSVS